MKSYHFAQISARDYPTIKSLDHPYIWGGVQFCLNVSEKPYPPELQIAMKKHGIDWLFCPVSEDTGANWVDSLKTGVKALLVANNTGKKIVVHCDYGNNRSRAFVEALYYNLTETEFNDEYKGEINHLAYNCKVGHLPELKSVEKWLRLLTA
jgi:hypothetical protein